MNIEDLYHSHGERLYRYLVFRLSSAVDAEDVLQEAFCRFARYGLRWKLVRNPKAFVLRIARNEANRFLKRKIVRREGEAMMLQEGGGPTFAAAFAGPVEPDLTALLREADDLPPEQKEIVFLKIFYGLTFKEIGSVCDIPANTAASRYRLGLAKLREAAGGKS